MNPVDAASVSPEGTHVARHVVRTPDRADPGSGRSDGPAAPATTRVWLVVVGAVGAVRTTFSSAMVVLILVCLLLGGARIYHRPDAKPGDEILGFWSAVSAPEVSTISGPRLPHVLSDSTPRLPLTSFRHSSTADSNACLSLNEIVTNNQLIARILAIRNLAIDGTSICDSLGQCRVASRRRISDTRLTQSVSKVLFFKSKNYISFSKINERENFNQRFFFKTKINIEITVIIFNYLMKIYGESRNGIRNRQILI